MARYVGEIVDFLEVVGGPVSKASGKKNRLFWECRCVCGKELTIRQDNLGSRTHSCGCKQHVVLSSQERFMRHLEKTTQDCWVWRGAVDRDRRGIFAYTVEPLKIIRANKASMLLATGLSSISDAILNKCSTWNCVNPDHLFIRESDPEPAADSP